MSKKIFLLRAAIIVFNAACLIFAVYILIKKPVKNDIYGFFAHDKRFFHCPSCGATRAIYCYLTGDFKNAFYYHAFLTLFFPVLLYTEICLSVNLFFQKKVLPFPKKYPVYLYALFFLLVAFTFIRNFTAAVY